MHSASQIRQAKAAKSRNRKQHNDIKNHIITNLEIHHVEDSYKLKPFLENLTLKINKSQIARELEVDCRTVENILTAIRSQQHVSQEHVLQLITRLWKN